ncbi:MAG: hypothetical protein P1Q69_09550 [Candidatus Thorarchaeota archaeon]|nr:hypothetical protein [Candidatus Thorarchaeota archaeon]
MSKIVQLKMNGTWNIAPLFMVRANQLANEYGEIALLVPNSILRVGQFSKTRRFLLDEADMWCIIDEGNPFNDVTLEMVSIFWSNQNDGATKSIEVVSRRQGLEGVHNVPRNACLAGSIFSLYYDDIMKRIQAKGTRGMIRASRGRDIPSDHVHDKETSKFTVPYATKGRSVRRYKIENDYLRFTDNWYERDEALRESFANEFLIATKNYPYPRCVMKPKGTIHGGGIVRVIPVNEELNMASIGLILNSRLVRYLSNRYLTNYAQLTTCLNTGIIEEIPLTVPENQELFAFVYNSLQQAHSNLGENEDLINDLETYANTVVYAQYFSKTQVLDQLTENPIWKKGSDLASLQQAITHEDIQKLIRSVMENPFVKKIETSPGMN